MTDEEMDIELIEKYHKGLLDEVSLEAFLEREKRDKDFADKVKLYRYIISGIEYYGKQLEVAESISGWENEIKGHDKKKHFEVLKTSSPAGRERSFFMPSQGVYWMAAAVITLLIVSSVFLLWPSSPDNMALYKMYYQPYPNVFDPTVRGDADTDTVSTIKDAFRAYNEGDYNKAIEYFNEALSHDDKLEKDNALFYLGNSYLAIDSAMAAQRVLEQIDEQSHVSDQAKWYLGLAYLKSNDLEGARIVLEELTNHSNSYRDKASKIIQEIK